MLITGAGHMNSSVVLTVTVQCTYIYVCSCSLMQKRKSVIIITTTFPPPVKEFSVF